jgi:hypothetical protein
MSPLSRVEAILRVVATAAARHEPLPAALADLATPEAHLVAQRLNAGNDLPTAVQTLLPAEQRALLAGPRPPLATVALLAADELAERRAVRAGWFDQLAHPLLSLLLVTSVAVIVTPRFGLTLAYGWICAAMSVAMLAVLLAYAATRQRSGGHGLHRQLAQRWERAAVAARWGLPEAQLATWFGTEVAQIGRVLSRPDAEGHCRRLAAWHRETAVRTQRRLAMGIALLVLLAGAAMVLATAVPAIGALDGFVSDVLTE